MAWLTLLMGLTTFTVVVLRYGFDTGAIALQELVIYLHASAFMLGIAYTLKQDAHVRVDVIYARLSPRGQAWVNVIGNCLFLLPCTLVFAGFSFSYVGASWQILEGSVEVGGIPGLFLLKTLIPLMALTLLAQGCVETARCVRTIRSTAADQTR